MVHVIDASDPGFERQIAVTEEVIEEIGAGKLPRLRVFNKIDRVGDAKAQMGRAKELRANFPKCIVTNALDADDMARLHKAIRAFFGRRLARAELFLPWSAQQLRGALFAQCEVLEERADTQGTFFSVRACRAHRHRALAGADRTGAGHHGRRLSAIPGRAMAHWLFWAGAELANP